MLIDQKMETKPHSANRFAKKRVLKRISRKLWVSGGAFDFETREPNDYYRAYFEDPENEPYARITRVDGESLDALLWDGENKAFGKEAKFSMDAVALRTIIVVRKYHEITVRYRSEAEFLLKDFWYPFTFRLWERLVQGCYNVISPIRADRLSVLAAILDKRLNDNEYDYILERDIVTTDQIMVKMYGQRVFHRRDIGRIHSRIDLILQSLVDSEEIVEASQGCYRPLGKAITTVSEAATDDRRHRDFRWLTVALIFVGLLGLDWPKLFGWAAAGLEALFGSVSKFLAAVGWPWME